MEPQNDTNGKEMTGAQMVMEAFVKEGVDTIFGLPGGANLPLYDVLESGGVGISPVPAGIEPKSYPIKHYLVKHEQCAAHAADAYARVTGKAGVCYGTSGPGATNLVTGIANAFMDSIPLVCVTGQVISALIGRDGFQEADIQGITIPITKHNELVRDVNRIPAAMQEAFYIATTGRPGPVLVDIPRDVLQQKGTFRWADKVQLRGYRPSTNGLDSDELVKAVELIEQSEKPVIIAGHGVIIGQAYGELMEFAEKTHIPVITTLLGISGFPGTHPLYLGMPGMHGMYWNNMAISEADLVIGIGMRFDDRVTGRLKDFAPKAKIIHMEIDPAEIGKNVRPSATLQGDVKRSLAELNRLVGRKDRHEWFLWLDEMRRKHPSITMANTHEILPQYVIQQIYEATKGDTYVVTGVGQHQMWAAQYFWYDKPNSFITSGGLGTMGFEVPAAMGAQVAAPNDTVWSICGDGGFQMTLQELATINEYEWPIKFAILNNGNLGMVRQWQQLFYQNNTVATPLKNPDFVKLAEAYGVLGLRAERREEVPGVIAQAMEHRGPVVVDFQVKYDENCYPMVPPGASLYETIDNPVHAEEREKVATR
ncbi:MAG TPA: biosynthetic-type acetolactate synthase large subunit [Dehalococcoidia bacterium]|nr:biosynthetic-type acetolactate synthase large subunit [Dehalococcoidia bacterium]